MMIRYVTFGLLFLFCLITPWSAEAAARTDMAKVSNLKISTENDKVRIVVNTSQAVKYSQMNLNNPNRIVIDIKNAWLDNRDKAEKNVNSRFVGKVRLAQFDETTVRLVVHTKFGHRNHKVFTLNDPYRLVLDVGTATGTGGGLNIDLWGRKSKEQSAKSEDETEIKDDKKGEAKDEPEKAQDNSRSSDKRHAKNDNRHDEDEEDDNDADKDDEDEDNAVKKPRRFFEFLRRENKDSDGSLSETDKAIAELTGLKGRVIAIDPGHGGSDPGAIGPTGVTEKSVTLRVGLELKKILEKEGAVVHMTRTRDKEVSPKGKNATDIEELQARCDVANASKADIFISIHMDSFTNAEANGTTGYYYSRGSAKSRSLADKIRAGVIEQIRTNSRGTQPCSFYVVKHTDMPATLLEVAFISNEKEEKLLNSNDGIKRAAQGIADGIADYFG